MSTDENHEEGYFYYEIPEDGQTQVNLQLMSRLKSERWEKWDSSDPANRYGEVLTVDLRCPDTECSGEEGAGIWRGESDIWTLYKQRQMGYNLNI